MSRVPSTAVKTFYQSIGVEMHGHRKKLDFFIDALARFRSVRRVPASAVRVLEIGCSNGRNVALPLAELTYDVTGLDIHAASIDAANAANNRSNARFLCMDLADYAVDPPHDVLILSDVLEHVDDPARMIQAAMRHLAPDGIVLVSIPNGYGPFEIERFLIRVGLLKPILLAIDLAKRARGRQATPRGADLPAYNWDSGHVQFFSERAFRRLLAGVGLQVTAKGNGCLFGGEVTSYAHAYCPGLTEGSLRAADHLPSWLVSTWYFECRRA
jgi:SAM-dependent methyltransferase